MIQSLESLHRAAQERGNRVLAVAAAQDAEVLLAVDAARKLGIATAILVGDESRIRAIAHDHGISLEPHQIVPEPDPVQACRKAVKLVREGRADAVMKGIVDTSVILKAVLDREIGLRDAPVLSHVALFQVPGFDRLLYVTDAAMNIAPDLEAKKHIIGNAVKVAHALGNPNPIVACLCAVEKVNPKMPATLDAAALVEANRAGACRAAPSWVLWPWTMPFRLRPPGTRALQIPAPVMQTSFWSPTSKPETCFTSPWSSWPRRKTPVSLWEPKRR